MSKVASAFSYAFRRNIGWQDRTIRTLLGLAAVGGAIYCYPERPVATALLAVFAMAQAGTVLSARCILCYLGGACTIDRRERNKLQSRGIEMEPS